MIDFVGIIFPKSKYMRCERCDEPIPRTRMPIMSWFTEETICHYCHGYEEHLKKKMLKKGIHPDDFEGCGYIPKI